MYISFYIDDDFYSGEAEPVDDDREIRFNVDLGNSMKFILYMSEDGFWASDGVSSDIVRAVGSEIERHDESFRPEPLQPGKYYSSAVSGGQAPVIVDGEIQNEPEHVDEQSENI